MIPLIECHADVGRLCNRFFGFFALAERVAEPELGIGVVLVSGEELQAHAASGRISASDHIGLLYLAVALRVCRSSAWASSCAVDDLTVARQKHSRLVRMANDQHVPPEPLLERLEHLTWHCLEPGLQVVFVVDVLLHDVRKDMRLIGGHDLE